VGIGADLTAQDSSLKAVPTLQLVHGELELEGVSESGLGQLGSQIRASRQSLTFSRVGMDVANEFRAGSLPVRLGGNAAWVHQFESAPPESEARLQSGGYDSWNLQGAPLNGDALRVGGFLEVDLHERRRIRVYGEEEFLQGGRILRGGISFSLGF
jgi:hypothetical protein